MTKTKSTLITLAKWTAACLGLLIALLIASAWLINHSPVQARIRDAVAARTAGLLTFRHLDISLLPRPHLTLNDAVLSVPGKISGTVPEASVYPEIMPLLSGEVLIAKVTAEGPDFLFLLSEEARPEQQNGQTAFQETRAELESVMADLRGVAPDFVGVIRNGKITVSGRANRTAWTVSRINGTFGLLDKGFSIEAAAEAPHWGRITAKGELLIGKNSLALRNATLSGGHSSFSGLSARFGWRVTPWLSVTSGSAVIALEDVYERRNQFSVIKSILQDVQTFKGRITLTTMNFRGRLLYPDQWTMHLEGALDSMVFASPLFPHPLTLSHAAFEASTGAVRFNDAQLASRDSWITASGTITGWTGDVRSVELSLAADIGPETAAWAVKTFRIPPSYMVRTPVALSSVRVAWKKGGAFSVDGGAAFRTGTTVAVDMSGGRSGLRIRRLAINREKENAVFTMDRSGPLLDLSFRGSVNQETLDRIFVQPPFSVGWVKGDARVRLDLERPGRSTAEGTLAGGSLFFEPKRGQPVLMRTLAVHAENRTVTVTKASLLWGDTPLEATGRIGAAESGFKIDLDVIAGSARLDRIIDAFSSEKTGEEKEPGPLPVQGAVRISANDLTIGEYVFAPTKVNVFLDRNSVRVEVVDARLCGISIRGHVQPIGDDLLVDLQPVATAQQMEPLLDCLSSNKRITGTYDLLGKFHAKGKSSEIVRSLDGTVHFSAKDGKFYTYPLLARILAFLNVTELLRGKLPDMGRDGFAYSSVKVSGTMKGGKLLLTQAVVEGKTLNLAAEGEIDFSNNTIDVTVLVAPFKTIEFILSKIPVIRNLLANKLITVPIRLTGDLNNPDISPLDPAAIGQNLLSIMRNVLSLPFRVLDPLLHPGD